MTLLIVKNAAGVDLSPRAMDRSADLQSCATEDVARDKTRWVAQLLFTIVVHCDLRPDKFQPQNHVAGDHGTAFCCAMRHPAFGSPCGKSENPFRQKGPTEIA